jgi:NAD(P)-dependent dehydrogenase (short-subunit alcohol dehydrogenase family)
MSRPEDAVVSARRAVVTGAGSGIGRATALRLALDGYDLLAVDRDAGGLAALRTAATEIRTAAADVRTAAADVRTVTVDLADRDAADVRTAAADVRTVTVDLADRDAAEPAIAHAIGAAPVDVLVNCAGIGWAANTAETTAELWNTTIAVNLTATFALCQLVLPRMLERRSGVIVNMASAGAIVGLKRRAAYCASKAGVLGLTRAIAADHAADGIRVIAVCPGTVDSPWIDRILQGAEDPAATRAAMEQRQLDGRMGTPEEVAEWIAFVASDKGRFMNGAALVIDGGMTAV